MSRSLTESSSRTAAASSAEAKAKTAGRNLRGDAQSRASAADPAVLDQLLTYEALQSAMRAPREDDEEPSLLEQLQTPYETRVERAGGAPFEGLVDFGGISAAIFGGQSAAERDAALAAQRRGPDPSRFTPLGEENLGLSYGMLSDMYRPEIDPESGFIRDPDTGTYYRPDLLPSNSSTRLAEGTAPSLMDAFKPLEGLFEGIQAEERRLSGELDPADVQMPRKDPRTGTDLSGIDAMSIPLPGQVEGGDVIDVTVPYEGESDEARYARENLVTAPKKKTVLDSVVEGAGGLLEKTPLGGIAKSLFPDLWYGTGEAIKGIDDGVSYGSSGTRSVGTNFEDTANGGSLIEQQQPTYGGLQGFIDLNGNGIDDRLEGGMPPAYAQGPAPGNRVASFPTMPPYNPGRDNEWTYFSNNRLANGGIVHAYADGGSVAAEDPRMEVIAATEDVLEKIATGSPPDEQDAAVLKEFVAKFGDAALRQLNDNVKAGMKMNPSGRRISGPGGPKDDAIPAVIDGVTPAALSDGEFVMPVSAVEGAGGGDPERGAEALQELSERLSGRAAA